VAVTTKGAIRPQRCLGACPPEKKFAIWKLGNAISSVLGIKKRVDGYFY